MSIIKDINMFFNCLIIKVHFINQHININISLFHNIKLFINMTEQTMIQFENKQKRLKEGIIGVNALKQRICTMFKINSDYWSKISLKYTFEMDTFEISNNNSLN